MTTTTATMTYAPPAQGCAPNAATASPILLRRGHSGTPLFLHRTPVYQVRSTASMSHLPTSRPSTTQALSRPYAPAAEYTRREPTTCKILVSVQPHPAHNRSLTVATAADPPSFRTGFNYQSHAISVPRPPPPNKALPPIPFPAGPPTPPEDTSVAPEFFTSVTPSRVAAARPVSQDTEDTIRELELLAASLQKMSASMASAGALGARHDHRVSTVKASSVSVPLRRAVQPNYAGGTSSSIAHATFRRPVSETTAIGPQIIATNPSVEALPPPGQPHSVNLSARLLSARKVDLEGLSWKGEDSDAEEVLWVDQYGAWGASEKGKWKAIVEEVDSVIPGQVVAKELGAFRARPRVAEESYIYESLGAPEFLVGSSTSRDAHAAVGYRSRPSLPHKAVPSIRRSRRPRPAPLVLAGSAEAELALATALLLGTPRKRSSSRRPQTAPHTTPHTPHAQSHHIARARQPTPPSSMSARQQQAIDAADVSRACPAEPQPSIAPAITADATANGHVDVDNYNRHSEPLPAMPRVPSSAIHVLRGKLEHEHARPMTAPSAPSGSHSEPNSPRPVVRPRLKSLKGLFKHWSK